MAWNDKPTYAQISMVYKWLSWKIPTETAQKASQWLEDHANRYQVSLEMKRLRTLYNSFKLNDKNCFESDVWRRFDPKGGDTE